MSELYANLVLELSNTKIDKMYTYKIPNDLVEAVFIGCPVFVYFGSIKKKIKAYIIELKEETSFDKTKIKDIISIIDFDLATNKNLLSLAIYIKKHYGCTFAKAISTVMPVKGKFLKKRENSKNNFFYNINKDEKILYKALNQEQTLVCKKFLSDYNNNIFKTYLLHGITGSGKTFVYINITMEILKKNKQVIVLIPEISLTYQMLKQFVSFFGEEVAILNSKLTKKEREREFERIINKKANIIIGPRSALFAPFDNLGLIIIDEEHDSAYKNDNIPRYDARDLAVELAKISKASLILASATPSPESYKKALDKEYELLELKNRANKNAYLPKIHIVDLRNELKNGNRSIFSKKLEALINDRLGKKEQIILFMNRRGMSNFISCRSCGNVIKCPHCDVSLTLHNNNQLYCHYCSYKIEMPKICPSCSSIYISGFGIGTQKLEIITQKKFPNARILRLDQDTNKTKKNSLEILQKFANNEADILLGTQMIVKGHDFENVSLVGIMAADTSLYINDYTSTQRTYELITQAAGRAGRGEKKGDVLIQTYNPMHYSIQACFKNDYNFYYNNEIAFRELANYPPIIHILGVQLSTKDEGKLNKAVYIYMDILNMSLNSENTFNIIGPVIPNIYKIKDYFRKIIYIKDKSYDKLIYIKEKIDIEIDNIKIFNDISIIYDLT